MDKIKYILCTAGAAVILIIVLPIVVPFTGKDYYTRDYRVPYYQGEDYFLYGKYADSVSERGTIAAIGDSVIWGHYTSAGETLTAQLNREAGTERFSNLGIDGIHPAAMHGLTESFCRKFRGKKIIVGINLLWMSSPRHDLTGIKNSEINHRMLLPQFTAYIPAYSPAVEERLSFLIKRESPFLLWVDHVKLTKFKGKSFYRWSMDNPSEGVYSFLCPENGQYEIPAAMDFTKLPKQEIEWIAAGSSLQWSYTVKTIKLLQGRNNRVLAIVTPFNRHMLTYESAQKYDILTNEVRVGLENENITVVMPSVPWINKFADSSHPTGEGYGTIAKELMENTVFLDFINE